MSALTALPGLKGGDQSHVGSVHRPAHRFDHHERPLRPHQDLHDGHQPRGISNRSPSGLYRFVPQLLRGGIDPQENGGRQPGQRGYHHAGQQPGAFPLQTDQHPSQQHLDQSPDRHVRLQSLPGNRPELRPRRRRDDSETPRVVQWGQSPRGPNGQPDGSRSRRFCRPALGRPRLRAQDESRVRPVRGWSHLRLALQTLHRGVSSRQTLANDLQLSCNLQISQFKSIMYKYYVDALDHNYDPEDPRSWKTICPSCNVSRNVSVHLRCFF